MRRKPVRPAALLIFLALVPWTVRAQCHPANGDPWPKAESLLALHFPKAPGRLKVVLEADGWLSHRITQEDNARRILVDVLDIVNEIKQFTPPDDDPLLLKVSAFRYRATETQGPRARVVIELREPVDYFVRGGGKRLVIELLPVGSGGLTPANPSIPEVEIEPPGIDPLLFFGRNSNDSQDYRLGPEDVVEVRVFELDELQRILRVSGDGRIELPLVGSLSVRGLTAQEVSRALANRLEDRFVQNPQVSVFIREFRSQNISVLGQVAKPSTYPLLGRRNLLQLLADAGGLGELAGSFLYLFRESRDGLVARLSVPLDELMLRGNPRWNVWVRPGDVITVPPESTVTVSVLGAVIKPGIHELKTSDGATLLTAISLAGGLNERGSPKGIQIKRGKLPGEETLLTANLDDILAGKAEDIEIRDGDVILVKESFF